MSTVAGITKRDLTFKNWPTGRSIVVPAGQKVRVRDTFAVGTAYTLTADYKGETYKVNGMRSGRGSDFIFD